VKSRTGRRLDDGQIEVVDPALAEVLRRKTTAERIAMVSSAHTMARLRIEAHLRTRYPDWPDDRIAREVTRRMTREAG